ncbi:MAG: endonuclease [Bacteroidota bacterium]
MKNKFLIGFALVTSTVFGQTDIMDARTNFAIGQTVTVTGVVTNGSELGPIRYMQDATGSIAAYGSMLNGVNRGDSITVTGPMIEFSGLLEVSTVTNVVNHGQVGIPSPTNVAIPNVNESIEARLVRLDNVTFVETGSFVANSNYNVTDGTNTLQVRVSGSGTDIDGTTIPTGAISLTGLVGQFNTAYQIIPRALNDIVAYVAPGQEINVKIGGASILTNSTYVIGNTVNTTVTIENYGAANMDVTGVSFTGANAADFSTTYTGSTIGAGLTQTFDVVYTASGNGSRFATLNILSNDADESTYLINLEAVGVDGLADEPLNSATNITFPNVKAYTLTLNFDGVVSANKYLVVWKNGSAPSDLPVDGTSYLRGDYVGSSKVAYSGLSTAIVPRGIVANQTYHFAIYPYNGAPGFENYLTTNPLIGSITSSGANVGNYYSGITSAETTLLSELTAKINPHTVVTYVAYKSTVMNVFEEKDTTAGQSFVTCAYSGENKKYSGPFDWTTLGYSREHTFSHSWMPTFPSEDGPEYSDQHNLYPTNLNEANSPRSNLPLGIVVTPQGSGNYLEGKKGLNATGQTVYEPRDAQKGNAARAIFYMATAYNGISGNNWRIPSNQDQIILKEWHFADLPDNYEIARHELMFANQGNRNPFIDSVEFACFIDFDNMVYNNDACNPTIGLENLKVDNTSISIFPNPSKDKVTINVKGTEITSYFVTDVLGRKIAEQSGLNNKQVVLNVDKFNNGSYIIIANTPFGSAKSTFVVSK